MTPFRYKMRVQYMIAVGNFNKFRLIPCLIILTCIISCGDDITYTGNSKMAGSGIDDWLVPLEEVIDGGTGKDGIPALVNPKLIPASKAEYLKDDDLIVGYRFEEDIRAYPHKILNWHEIVNDDLNGRKIAIFHCPLTGTSVGWERDYSGQTTTFGVSGLLYNTNLMPYDRTTNGTWSQISGLCVNGELIGTKAKTFQVFETEWKTWKTMYPNSRVMSIDTGHTRNYSEYPYGDYRSAPGLLYSVSVKDSRLFRKERVHGVVSSDGVGAKLYRFDSFQGNKVVTDNYNGQTIIIGSKEKNFIISFKQKKIDDTVLTFKMINGFNSPEILEDQLGNKWDVFGNAVSGPNAGEKLMPTNSFIGMFFSWAPFYNSLQIF